MFHFAYDVPILPIVIVPSLQIALMGGTMHAKSTEEGKQPAGAAAGPRVPTKPMEVSEFLNKGIGAAQLPRKDKDRKDKEKEKRMKGQSAIGSWKTEAEMACEWARGQGCGHGRAWAGAGMRQRRGQGQGHRFSCRCLVGPGCNRLRIYPCSTQTACSTHSSHGFFRTLCHADLCCAAVPLQMLAF